MSAAARTRPTAFLNCIREGIRMFGSKQIRVQGGEDP